MNRRSVLVLSLGVLLGSRASAAPPARELGALCASAKSPELANVASELRAATFWTLADKALGPASTLGPLLSARVHPAARSAKYDALRAIAKEQGVPGWTCPELERIVNPAVAALPELCARAARLPPRGGLPALRKAAIGMEYASEAGEFLDAVEKAPFAERVAVASKTAAEWLGRPWHCPSLDGALKVSSPDPVVDDAPAPKHADDEQLGRVMRRSWHRLATCRDASAPKRAGRVVVAFTIGATGAVENVKIASTTLASGEAERCMLEVVRGLSFAPPSDGRPVAVTYPLDFKAE